MNKIYEVKISKKRKKIFRETLLVYLIASILIGLFSFTLMRYEEKENKMNASYMAEDIVRKIEVQLSGYMQNSALLKNLISSGDTLDHEKFSHLASAMIQNEDVVESV